MSNIQIGDRIKFRVTLREGTRTATRVVTGFYFGEPTVGFNGYRDFIVRRSEILDEQKGVFCRIAC